MPRPVFKSTGAMYFLAALVGGVAGAGAILFDALTRVVSHLVLHLGVGYVAVEPQGDLTLFDGGPGGSILIMGLLLAPALGGLVSGWLTCRFAPEASGHGTDSVIDAYHNRDGQIRGRVPIVKALATALSLGTGGSGGREGPIAQIGAGFGSFLGRRLGLTARHRRVLLAAGMGAGVGSIFRAPLAGALFSAEILYRESEFESDVVMPSFISSSVAYCVLCTWHGRFDTLFRLSAGPSFRDLAEMLPYTVLALVLVPVVFLFIKVFYGVERRAQRLPLPRAVTAGLGGLLCGAVAVVAWRATGDESALAVLSFGYGILQQTFDGLVQGNAGVVLLAVVAVGKILTTSFTISSGGSGGVFGPSMVIGGSVGGIVGILGQQHGWVANPSSFVVVGMCGFFAGAARTPISTIIMVSEMTGSYRLLLPAMWVCALTFILCSRWTIYIKQARNRAQSLAHRGEFMMPLLAKMKVADVFDPDRRVVTVRESTPLREIVHIVANSHADYFPVLDESGRFVGIFSSHDVREYTYDDSLYQIAIAADLMVPTPIVLTPEDDLHTALTMFNIRTLDELPVVADEDSQRLLGMLPRRSISRAYNRRLQELESLQRENE